MNKLVHVVGLLTLVLSSVSHDAEAAMEAVATLASAVASIGPTAARYLYQTTPVLEGTTTHLDTLLQDGNFLALSKQLRDVLQSDRSALGMDYRNWVEHKQSDQIPLIEYIAFRDGVNTAHKATRDKVGTLLMLMYQFCLHYHIDAMICIKAATEDSHRRSTGSLLSFLTAMRDNFKKRWLGIMNRVEEKFHTVIKQVCPSGVLHEQLQHAAILRLVKVIKTAPLATDGDDGDTEGAPLDRHSLGIAAWVFNVERDNRFVHSVADTLRGYVGSSLLGNPTGGIVFHNPNEAQRSTLSRVAPTILKGWYNQLRASLLEYLETNVSDWDPFFNEKLWNNWLEEQVDLLKPPAGSSDSASIALSSEAGAGHGAGGASRSRHSSSDASEAYSSCSDGDSTGTTDGSASAGGGGGGGAGAPDAAMTRIAEQLHRASLTDGTASRGHEDQSDTETEAAAGEAENTGSKKKRRK